MKLLKVTKGGALHFQLSDGRTGATYPSGYVRVSPKFYKNYTPVHRMYQINPVDTKVQLRKSQYDGSTLCYTVVERLLIPKHADRVRLLLKFNEKNCK